MGFNLPVGDGDGVVIQCTFLEVGVCADEFNVFCPFFEPAAVLQNLFKGDACPAGGGDRTFAPRCVDEFVAVPRILVDLLDTARTGALECDDVTLAREDGLVFQLGQRDTSWGVDESADVEEEGVFVDSGDPAMVPYEVVFVGCDGVVYQSALNGK